MSYMQQRIKEAIEKAEVGPWAKVEFSNGHMEVWQSIDNTSIAKIWGNNETASANAHLIANAPTWLLHQQELIEQKDQFNIEICKQILELESIVKQKDAEIARLREQLGYLKLTPMQKMSRSMDILSQLKKEESP